MQPDKFAAGRYELGNGHYMNIDEVNTEPSEHRRYEAHQDYCDIQIVLWGHEIIQCAPLSVMENMVEANVDKDVYFYEYNGKSTTIPMTKGTYVVFYPGDAHKPLIAETKAEPVKKIIIKYSLNAEK